MNETINAFEAKTVNIVVGGKEYQVKPLTVRTSARLGNILLGNVSASGVNHGDADAVAIVKLLQNAGDKLPEVLEIVLGEKVEDLTLVESLQLANAMLDVNDCETLSALFTQAKAKIKTLFGK